MSVSPKFVMDGVIRVGSLMLISADEVGGHSLQTVMQIQEEGLHLCEFEPGVTHPIEFVTFDKIWFPIPLTAAASMSANQPIGALFNLQEDPNQPPDWTTVYYPAVVNKSQKGVPRNHKGIIYHNVDGSKSPAILPLEAYLPSESQPFPTCVSILPVNDAHIHAALAPPPVQTTAPTISSARPVTPATSAASKASPARSSVASPNIHAAATPTSSNAVKLVVKRSTGSTTPIIVQAVTPSPVASTPPTTIAPTPISVAPTPSPISVAASSSTPPSATDTLGKRKYAAIEDISNLPNETPASPNSVGSSAPSSPSNKRQKKEKKKKEKSTTAIANANEGVSSWDLPLPADPATMPIKWTLESLTSVIPALNSMTLNPNISSSTAASSSSSSTTAPAAAPTLSNLDDHPLSKSLSVEFANWDSMQATKSASQSGPAAPSSTFIAYNTAMGQTHYFDQLKRITEKQLIAAPYVLDYILQ